MINFRVVKRFIRDKFTVYVSRKHPDIIDRRKVISIMEKSKIFNIVLNASIIIIPVVTAVNIACSLGEAICVLFILSITSLSIFANLEELFYANIDDMEEYIEEVGDIMVRNGGSINPSMMKIIDILEELIIENRRGLSDKVNANITRYNVNMLKRLDATLEGIGIGSKIPNQLLIKVSECGSGTNGFRISDILKRLEVLRGYTFRQPFSEKFKMIEYKDMTDTDTDRETFYNKVMELYETTVYELNKI